MRVETTIGVQSTLNGEPRPIRRNRFDRPLSELRELVEAAQVECHECEAKGRPGKRMMAVEVYDDPWQEEPRVIHVCSYEDPDDYDRSCFDLLTDASWADFRYFLCSGCGRMVISQCPSNGWHSYVRIVEDEEVCLKCYEEGIFENGLPREEFQAGKIPGMFLNREELEEHGFEPVEEWQDYFINGQESADRFCAQAMQLIDAGRKVAVDYDSLGIGGGEGYVSLYAK